jgi:hypothetical protein
MDDSAFRHGSLRFVPFVNMHVTSLLLNHVAVFVNGLCSVDARKAWDAIRQQPTGTPEPCANSLKSI